MGVLGYDSSLDVLDPGGTRHVFDTETADLGGVDIARDSAASVAAAIARQRAGIVPDKSQQAATRAAQLAQFPALQSAAAGQGPSAAQIQGGQAAGQEAARQFAMAQAIRSHNGAAALNQASQGLSANSAQIAQQSALNRANEQSQARNSYTGAATSLRGGDLGVYGADQSLRNADLAALIASQKTQAQAGEDAASASAQAAGLTNQSRAAKIQGGASFGAGLLSDKRSKRGARDQSLADALAKEVHGVTFEYKGGLGDGPGKHFGVMAQDVEKVIPGVVREREDGMKEINAPHLTAANTALISELAKRIRSLEGRK